MKYLKKYEYFSNDDMLPEYDLEKFVSVNNIKSVFSDNSLAIDTGDIDYDYNYNDYGNHEYIINCHFWPNSFDGKFSNDLEKKIEKISERLNASNYYLFDVSNNHGKVSFYYDMDKIKLFSTVNKYNL